jgi:uncharacterized membrane protein
MKYFFLILLIIVLVYLSVKPEGFDASNNSLDSYTFSNIAFFTIVFVLFVVIIFLILKLRSL